MKQYRKKPVVIEAIQYKETNRTQRLHGVSIETNAYEIADFMKQPVRSGCSPNGQPEGETFIEIETLEGTMRASLGDWIIKGVAGEFYPCKPDIFEATYEAVTA